MVKDSRTFPLLSQNFRTDRWHLIFFWPFFNPTMNILTPKYHFWPTVIPGMSDSMAWIPICTKTLTTLCRLCMCGQMDRQGQICFPLLKWGHKNQLLQKFTTDLLQNDHFLSTLALQAFTKKQKNRAVIHNSCCPYLLNGLETLF